MTKKRNRAGILGRLFLYLFTIFIVYLSCVGDYGLLRIHRLIDHQAELKANYRQVVAQAVDYSYRLRRIRSDRFYLEWLARTRYGYSQPDEAIFHITPPSH